MLSVWYMIIKRENNYLSIKIFLHVYSTFQFYEEVVGKYYSRWSFKYLSGPKKRQNIYWGLNLCITKIYLINVLYIIIL